MTTATQDISHAEANAKGWMDGIAAAYEAHQFCAEEGEGRYLSREAKALLHELGYDGENHNSTAEAIEEQMRGSPLAVDVRSGWQSAGGELVAEEFQILLSTGGPALRLTGELDEDSQPYRVFMQHQDWGTPWTQCFDVDRDALMWFASLFWFGE